MTGHEATVIDRSNWRTLLAEYQSNKQELERLKHQNGQLQTEVDGLRQYVDQLIHRIKELEK